MPKIATVAAAAITFVVIALPPSFAEKKMKLRGYITANPGQQTLKIMDDAITLIPSAKLELENAPPGKQLSLDDLAVGTLIEAEGKWSGKHQFSAQKIRCDWGQFDREIKESAFLDREPEQAERTAGKEPFTLKADGEILVREESTRVAWQQMTAQTSGKPPAESKLAGCRVRYQGTRRPDGSIATTEVEFGAPAPAQAFEVPEGIKLVRATDPKTGIDVLEFRKKKEVLGRLKLFPVKEVQDYVSSLGDKLLPFPGGTYAPAPALEFRFYVIEDATINAAAMPDGAILVNTGLLAALENEAQLAFVLSHEIAHVTQAHYWRHVTETRAKRVLLAIAGVVGGVYIGDLAVFLSQLGLVAVWNGYERRLENQADRLALQTLIDHGYDPREAPRLSQIIIERYGDRSTSALWSNHDSSVMRGSFLTIQTTRQYPQADFSKSTADTEAFRAMREAMGPVKIM